MSKRHLFFRSGAIGDIIHCLPALKLVKEKNPEDSIELVVATKHIKDLLVKHCPYIDKIYEVKKRLPESKELLESIKDNPIETFTYWHSNWRGLYWNFRFIKAKQFFGYKKDTNYSAIENFSLTILPLLSLEKEEAIKALDHHTLMGDCEEIKENYICIVIGVGKNRPTRAYPKDHWLDFITEILHSSNYSIKLMGGPDEKELSWSIAHELENLDRDSHFYQRGLLIQGSPRDSTRVRYSNSKPEAKLDVDNLERVENIVAQTTLLEAATVLKNAKHVFSADTGLLHIAAALDSPVTTMFSITSEHRTGPFSPKAHVLRSSMCECKIDNSNSKKHCSNKDRNYAKCMWDIAPSRLLDNLEGAKSPTC